ncbi:MAG: sialidase [Calditrichaeota bacterium]|nr:MAG: sialidase [Calditrichota bacterium]
MKNMLIFGNLVWLSMFSAILGADDVKIEYQRGYEGAEFIYPLDEQPTAECHASTLVETAEGIVAAWFGGSREGAPDVCIWSSRYNGIAWSQPEQVADGVDDDGRRHPCWNPVLYQPREDLLMLFYKVGPNPREWWGMLKTSTDQGRSWSPAERLPNGIVGPVKNKPIQLGSGAILCGASSENKGWESFIQITNDLGKTWKSIGPLNRQNQFDAIQPTLLVYKDGRIQALCRTKQGYITEVWSKDRGYSWTYMERSKLPNPNSGIDAVSLTDHRQLLVYNHSKKERTPLVAAIGNKKGTNWKRVLRLEEEPGEYSYPAVIQARDGLVHVSYTWNRKTIKHVVINPDKL